MQFELHTTIAEADKVVCIGIMRGLHDGPVHGLPPDLQTHRDTRHPVLTFNHDGLITDHLTGLRPSPTRCMCLPGRLRWAGRRVAPVRRLGF
jgi:hypothetical protein